MLYLRGFLDILFPVKVHAHFFFLSEYFIKATLGHFFRTCCFFVIISILKIWEEKKTETFYISGLRNCCSSFLFHAYVYSVPYQYYAYYIDLFLHITSFFIHTTSISLERAFIPPLFKLFLLVNSLCQFFQILIIYVYICLCNICRVYVIFLTIKYV